MIEAEQPRAEARDVVHDIATSIHSDILAQWHVVLRGLPAFAKVLSLPNQLHLVIDASVVIAEVRWMVKKRDKQAARTALQEVIASGTVIAYAPPLLRVEVEKRLRTIADSEGILIDQLMAAWASYEPLLRFVEAPSLPDVARMAAARDPNDAPYFELQVGIDASAVYTDDPDLRGMGAPVVSREAVTAARDFARAASISFTFRISGLVVLTAGIATVQVMVGVLRGGLRAARRLPGWMQILFIAAMFAMLLNARSRKWMLERLATMGSHAWAAMRELMPLVVAAMEHTTIAKATSEQAWSRVSHGLPERIGLSSQPLFVHVLTACVRAARPLTTDEITQAVMAQGYRGGAPPSRGYLQRILRSHPTLTRTTDRRWQTRAV